MGIGGARAPLPHGPGNEPGPTEPRPRVPHEAPRHGPALLVLQPSLVHEREMLCHSGPNLGVTRDSTPAPTPQASRQLCPLILLRIQPPLSSFATVTRAPWSLPWPSTRTLSFSNPSPCLPTVYLPC